MIINFISLRAPFILVALIFGACADSGDGAPSGPPRIVAIMPPQDSYPVGQNIGIKTEKDCADCTVLFEDREVPLAGYYTLTLPADEGTPKTEALETTVGPGVVLPDIVAGCPKKNKIDDGCVAFVRVVQKGLKSNQRALLVVPAGSEEASPVTAPDQPTPQLTAPTAGTPSPALPPVLSPPVSPTGPPTSPVTSVTTGTAPTPVQAGDTTSTPVSSGTEKTPGKTGPASTRPSPPRPPVAEDDDDEDGEVTDDEVDDEEVGWPPPVIPGDDDATPPDDTTGGSSTETPPPPDSPAAEPAETDKKIICRKEEYWSAKANQCLPLSPVDPKSDEKSGSTPSAKSEPKVLTAAQMIDNIRLTIEPNSSGRGPQDFPLMQIVFCPTNAFRSIECDRFVIDPDPNPGVPEPQFTGLGLVAKFRHGLNAVDEPSYSNMLYPGDMRHLEFRLIDSYGIRGPRIFSLRQILIEAKQDGDSVWHRCEDINKEDLRIHNLDTRGRSHPTSFTLELDCQ